MCRESSAGGTETHQTPFSKALLQAGRWVYLSLQILGERKGDGKSIVHMVGGVWLGSPSQHSKVTARSDGCLVHS